MNGVYGGIPLVGLHGYDPKEVSRANGVSTGSESAVQQQFVNEVDINTIVRRFGLTRELPSGREGGVYGDFSGVNDFESAMEAIERAQSGFMLLDPQVREKFANDVGLYLEFIDSKSDEELAELGKPAPPVAAEPVPVASPAQPVPAAPPAGPPAAGAAG